MTDGRDGEPEFDDPTHAALRDLLKSAKVDTPIPAEVAARLDATLAGLTGAAPREAPVPEEDDPVVVPLRRRSRLAPRLLAAAVVVAVAGVGAVAVSRGMDHGSDDRTASADSAMKSEAGASRSAPEVPAVPPAAVPGPTSTESLTSKSTLDYATSLGGVAVLTTAGFADEAAGIDFTHVYKSGELADLRAHQSRGSVPTSGGTTFAQDSAGGAAGCPGPRMAGTSSYPVLLDDRPAVLVVHPPNAGTRLVEAWSCDGSQVLAFTSVPG